MSTLTEVTVYVSSLAADLEDDLPEEFAVHEWLIRPVADLVGVVPGDPRAGGGQALRPLDVEAAGGGKVFCGQVYAAAFNHVPPADVVAHLDRAPWPGADGIVHAVAIIDYEHDDGPPRVWRCPCCRDVEPEDT